MGAPRARGRGVSTFGVVRVVRKSRRRPPRGSLKAPQPMGGEEEGGSNCTAFRGHRGRAAAKMTRRRPYGLHRQGKTVAGKRRQQNPLPGQRGGASDQGRQPARPTLGLR